MDLRTRTSLFCGVLALAIAVSLVLRGRTQRVQLLFTAFAADMGLWYVAQSIYQLEGGDLWERVTAMLAVLLPQFSVHLFDAIIPTRERRSTLLSIATALMIPMVLVVFSPQHQHPWLRPVIFLYVFGLVLAGLWSLAVRGARSRSRTTQRRIRFLVLIGALAATFSLLDFLWFIGAPLPPVGAVLSIVFLFVLSESMVRQRLLDLYEILGRLLVATALAFGLAGIFYLFVVLFGGFEEMYLGAILAAIVILVLFEPLRDWVETAIHKAFFRERVEMERAVATARSELATTLQVAEMSSTVLAALEASGRTTGAALYLRDPNRDHFELQLAFGPSPPPRIDVAALRPLADRLSASGSVLLAEISFAVGEARRTGWARQTEGDERLLASCQPLGPYRESLCLGIYGERSLLIGLLLLVDDRVPDAYSQEDAAVLEGLAVQIGVVVENSRQYRRMQERDRLAALGQMAAGLAHEVKNPLGAIKGAAQLLAESPEDEEVDPTTREFVSIIIEEVDRLDRVVGSVLDYARPRGTSFGPFDLNAVARRTLQVIAQERRDECTIATDLASTLPPVHGDAEQLRQVLINLVRNAMQAMGGCGRVTVRTRERPSSPDSAWRWVEVSVADEGPGISLDVQQSLFVPFFTTKEKGTGLGLAISQRMVEEMGGRIEVASQPGFGSTFTVILPAGEPALRASNPPPPPAPASDVVSLPTRAEGGTS